MILIEEKKSIKIPGGTSLFVSFNYNPKIVDVIKQCTVMNYSKADHIWEVPCTDLSFLLDNLCKIDNITLNVLPDNNDVDKSVKLAKFKTEPFEYQKQGIEFGLIHNRFLLLDAPGLGKTLQLLYIAEQLHKEEKL